MDAITLLKSQHDEVDSLFSKYEKTKDENAKQGIFNVIADNLAAHTTIEEKLFYPAVYIGELEDDLQEAVEEHLSAKRVIADLLGMKPSDEKFDAKVKVLQELIEHHVEEEEGELFPNVRKLMPKRELEALGEAMEEMFDKLMEGSPRNQVPAETGQSAPLS
jgi:hemerythrin superfamily protein